MEIKRIKANESHLVISLFDKYRMFYKQPTNILLAENFIQTRLDNKESVIFVALSENKVPVGFTQLYPTYSSVRVVRNWILNDLYVDPAYRKQGLGEKLIRTAMEFAKEDESKFVELSTETDNYTAQKLYESIGFYKKMPETDFFTYRISVD